MDLSPFAHSWNMDQHHRTRTRRPRRIHPSTRSSLHFTAVAVALTATPSARRYRLLRHLRTAGRPVRAESLPVDRDDPAALSALAQDLRELQEHGLIGATPFGWVWRR